MRSTLDRSLRADVPFPTVVRDAIVVVRDEEGTLRQRVETLCDILADEGVGFRLWILDTGSADHTPDVAAELSRSLPQVRFAGSVEPTGTAAAIRSLKARVGNEPVVFGDAAESVGRRSNARRRVDGQHRPDGRATVSGPGGGTPALHGSVRPASALDAEGWLVEEIVTEPSLVPAITARTASLDPRLRFGTAWAGVPTPWLKPQQGNRPVRVDQRSDSSDRRQIATPPSVTPASVSSRVESSRAESRQSEPSLAAGSGTPGREDAPQASAGPVRLRSLGGWRKLISVRRADAS